MRRGWPLVAVLAAVAFGVAYSVAAWHGHTPARVTEVTAVRLMVSLIPIAAALLAALAILRPWPAYLGILVLTPVWNAAQINWTTDAFQVTIQTVFVMVLGIGCLMSRRRTRDAAFADARQRAGGRRGSSIAAVVASLALVAFLALALASTYASPGVAQSRIVLAHGIVEPIALGLILLGLRPNRMDLVRVAIALGLSAGVGCLINIVQTVPGSTLAGLQSHRLFFSILTYDSVGLLGEVLAMSVPLLVGVLLARRALRLRPSISVFVIVALAACLAGLFLTFSKSAWLATSVATALLVIFAARTWPARLAIVAGAGLLSAFVVPWPALLLPSTPGLGSAYRGAMVQLEGQRRYDSWNPATVAGEGSVTFHLRAAEAGVRMAETHPWLGVGLNQYKRFYMSGYAIPPIDIHVDHAHSMWPELAAELGFPAMGLVALIYAAALLALWRVYRNPPDGTTRLLAAMFMAALIAWVIVATAFGTDIYRSPRSMSAEIVMMTVVTSAAFALARSARRGSTFATH